MHHGRDQTEDQQPGGMAVPRPPHCRHCWSDCGGDCLLPGEAGDAGLCIHKPSTGLPWPDRCRLMRTRRFWRRVFWGVYS